MDSLQVSFLAKTLNCVSCSILVILDIVDNGWQLLTYLPVFLKLFQELLIVGK